MQQAFTETLETKRLYSQTENHRVSLSLSLLECHPLFIITVFFPLVHPDQPLQLFARLHSSCLPVLNCLVTSQSSQICIKSFKKLVFKKNSKWWPVSLGRNEPRAKNMFYKWTNGRAIWSYLALLDCGPGSGISCK